MIGFALSSPPSAEALELSRIEHPAEHGWSLMPPPATRSDVCKTLTQGLTQEHFGRRVAILGKEKPRRFQRVSLIAGAGLTRKPATAHRIEELWDLGTQTRDTPGT